MLTNVHELCRIVGDEEGGREAVQRALLVADPLRTTVTEVAMHFGFFHLGQFARDYRQAFQELPSETLRR